MGRLEDPDEEETSYILERRHRETAKEGYSYNRDSNFYKELPCEMRICSEITQLYRLPVIIGGVSRKARCLTRVIIIVRLFVSPAE